MAMKAIPYVMPASYHELIGQFPLARIHDEAHFVAACEVLDRLLAVDLDEGGQEYLDALAVHVGIYEDEHIAIPAASEADILRELMSANRLGQSQLASEVKISKSTISAVLAGRRSLTKDQVVRVAARFGVPLTVFLGG